MARKEVITDDLDESANAKEVRFAFEGRHYTIDLGEKNLNKLAKLLEPFIEHAREDRLGGQMPSRRAAGSSSKRNDPTFLASVRDWARKNGAKVSDRGRISQEVIAAYRDANK